MLAAFDHNVLERDNLAAATGREEYLRATAREGTQLLMNELLSLPKVKSRDGVFLQLPEMESQLPRAKPLPEPKPETKWERFARIKGITKRPREGRLAFDEESGEWVPRWGHMGKNKDIESQWLVELDDNDHVDNPRNRARKEREDRVAKNKAQSERNAALAAGLKPSRRPGDSAGSTARVPKALPTRVQKTPIAKHKSGSKVKRHSRRH